MLLKDRFELPVTCVSVAAVEDYVAAVDLLLSAWPGAEARLDRALAADPEFALAHIASARLLQLHAKVPDTRRPPRALSRSRPASRRASGVTSSRSHFRSTALPAMHWRWSARTPWNTGGTRSHYRWRSAFSGCWASAGGAIITRRSLLCSRS
jgi:hypothetical protein